MAGTATISWIVGNPQCILLTDLIDMVESPACSWTDPTGEFDSYGASSVNVGIGVATHVEASYDGTANNALSIIGLKTTGVAADYTTFNIWVYIDGGTLKLEAGILNYTESHTGTTNMAAGDLYGIFVDTSGNILIKYFRGGVWTTELTFTATYPSSPKYFTAHKIGTGKHISNLKGDY